MRRLSHGALVGFLTVNTLWLALTLVWPGHVPFPIFIVLFALAMFQFGWIGSNFNSLAMEPLGHVAGTASSVLGFMGTAGGTLIGGVIGQAFNGTALPLVLGFFVVSVIGLAFVLDRGARPALPVTQPADLTGCSATKKARHLVRAFFYSRCRVLSRRKSPGASCPSFPGRGPTGDRPRHGAAR